MQLNLSPKTPFFLGPKTSWSIPGYFPGPEVELA